MFPKTIKTSLVTHIRDAIIKGEVEPGGWLRLNDLAKRYNVSTMPIREALSMLESEGLLTIYPHRGAQVTSFTPDELLGIYEMRAVLEQLATLRAVPNLTEPEMAKLHTVVENMRESSETNDVVKFSVLNLDFHFNLYAACKNEHLCETVQNLRYRTQHYFRRYVESMSGLHNGYAEHRRLLDLIAARHAEAASHMMYDHVYDAGKAIAERMWSATVSQ
jgi:DNA-binding GntR family transcriptional regulator